MDILKENLELLNVGDKPNYILDDLNENIVIEKALNNIDTMKITRNERTVYVHSTYYPVEMSNLFVDNFLEEVELNHTNLIVLFGLGLGYELNHLKRCLGKEGKEATILVFEPEKSVVDNYIKNNLILNDDKIKVKVVFGKNILDKNQYMTEIIYNFENVKILKLQAYFDLYIEEYLKVFNNIKDLMVVGNIDRNTRLSNAEGWSEKEVTSLKYFFETSNIGFLKELLKDKPAVLVSAGPSLNKNIHLLKEVKNKYFIIAVYTAYRPLQKAGIEPDLIVSVDINQALYDEHKNGIDVPGAFSIFSNDSVKDKNKHKYNNLIKVKSDYAKYYFPEKFKDRLLISDNSCGTVASVALDILVQNGANPIIFMGQDLGYTDDGKTHVDGSFYDENLEIVDSKTKEFFTEAKEGYNKDEIYVKGNFADKIKTDMMMYSFIQWFNIYIGNIKKEQGTTFINATEGGAYIEGTEVMTFKDVIEKYEAAEGISSIFSGNLKNHPFFVNKEEKREMFDHIVSLYNDINTIVEITEKAEKASIELSELFKNADFPKQSKVKKIVKILDEEDAKLKELKDKFVMLQTAYFKCSYVLNNYKYDERLNETQIALKKDVYFHKELNNVVKTMKSYFEKLIDELKELYKFDEVR